MLRASGQAHREDYDLSAVVEGSDGVDSGVPHGDLLVRIAEAVVLRDAGRLAELRGRARAEMGDEQLVDAVGVAANFQRMVRVADGTGIPLDKVVMQLTHDVRGQLGIDHFDGARNTPRLGLVGRMLSGLTRRAFGRLARRSAS